MVLLRVKVSCTKCKRRVDKIETRAMTSSMGVTTHECFDCFKKARTPRWGNDEGIKMKREMYCQRCRYRFSSVVKICPYCNESDYLESGKIDVTDLL